MAESKVSKSNLERFQAGSAAPEYKPPTLSRTLPRTRSESEDSPRSDSESKSDSESNPQTRSASESEHEGATESLPPSTSSFDPEAPASLKRSTEGNSKAPYNWSLLTVAELVRFRDEINAALPPTELSKLNLEEEALLQYHTLRSLQALVMDDEEVPVNQRAQVANSVASTLKTLGDQQEALYTSERFKQIENALIRELSKLPEALAASFIDSYEKILRKYNK